MTTFTPPPLTSLNHHLIEPSHHHTITPSRHHTITLSHYYTITPSHHYTITPQFLEKDASLAPIVVQALLK
jgi:hypothetical protein